jgi:hypothetical protein
MWYVPRGYKRTKFRAWLVGSLSVKRRLGGWCEMAARLGVSQLKQRVQMWDMCQTVRTKADNDKIRYQDMTSED